MRQWLGMTGRYVIRFAAWPVACIAIPVVRPAQADDFCAERPGQTTPPCVMAPGRIMVEIAAADWSGQSDAGSRSDLVLYGAGQVRIGLAGNFEAQVGWTPLGTRRDRDAGSGQVTRTSGQGDVALGFLFGLTGRNGPVALQGFVTLPTGGQALGAGDWGAGMRLPVALDLGEGVQLGLTPELDAAVNASGEGRHLAYGGAAGISLAAADKWTLSSDLSLFRDEDPSGAQTRSAAGLSVAWQALPDLQLDAGGAAGLNHNTPSLRIYLGLARSF